METAFLRSVGDLDHLLLRGQVGADSDVHITMGIDLQHAQTLATENELSMVRCSFRPLK